MPRGSTKKFRVTVELDVEAEDARELFDKARIVAREAATVFAGKIKNPIRTTIKRARFINTL